MHNIEGGKMTDRKDRDIPEKLRVLEKRIEELEELIKKEKDLLFDEYLKALGIK